MKRSLKDKSGYLLIDHSDSPGINPEDIPERLRSITPIVSAGEVYERDIQFCAHCGSQVILNPLRERPRSYCANCDHYICDSPICNKTCEPLSKLFDKAEKVLYKESPESARESLILLTDRE